MWSDKAKYFENANSWYFDCNIVLRAYIGWSEKSTAATCRGFKVQGVHIFSTHVY